MCCSSASAASRTVLDALRAVRLDRLLDLPRVSRGVLDDVLAHLLLAALEQQVVTREIRVTEHVCRHEDVLCEPVAVREISVPGFPGNTTSNSREWPMCRWMS